MNVNAVCSTPGPSGSTATAVVGLQWGDEGKGKIVDLLAGEADVVVRYNGGANAGHSVVIEGRRHALHLVPSGILRPGAMAVIGNGVVVQPTTLLEELAILDGNGVDTSGLRISSRAHVVTEYHIAEDKVREALLRTEGGDASIGTTLRGIGPTYADKALRTCAIRMGDLCTKATLRKRFDHLRDVKAPVLQVLGDGAFDVDHERAFDALVEAGDALGSRIVDTSYLLNDFLAENKRVLFEGANGTLLDLDHGSYPFVTSSNCSTLGIGPGTGVPAQRVGRIVGVLKAYSSRVGAGPMPTELSGEIAENIRRRGNEFGTTTGRPRRVGWLDLVAARYAVMINGCTEIALTLLDVLAGTDELKICTSYRFGETQTQRFPADGAQLAEAEPIYESLPGFADDLTGAGSVADLPGRARHYVDRIEDFVGATISIVSVGPDRAQTIQMATV